MLTLTLLTVFDIVSSASSCCCIMLRCNCNKPGVSNSAVASVSWGVAGAPWGPLRSISLRG